jgi:hypothetical protein
MNDQPQINAATVRLLAEVAGLSLAEGRAALLAPQLDIWIRGATKLSRKMSAPEHRTVAPVVVVTQPGR